MRAALLLDLGETLVHDGKPIVGVPQALEALAKMRTAAGVPLPLALVSNYTMPGPGAPPSEVDRLLAEYAAIVRKAGLLHLFEPVEHHITLSTMAGVRKPDAAIFELALRRLGLAPDLSTAMFITEEGDHVAHARALGMTAWQFGHDFHDWSEAPALVGRALAENAATGGPDADDRLRAMLEQNASIAKEGEPLAPGQTHALERGPDGKPRPVRKRFSFRGD